jgi:hypothetical protein
MKKIIINGCYGGYSCSEKAIEIYNSLSSNPIEDEYMFPRDCPIAISIVEKLGKESWGECSKLVIAEIPNHADWDIQDYDGQEWIETFMVLTKEELAKGLTSEKIQKLSEVGYIRLSSE